MYGLGLSIKHRPLFANYAFWINKRLLTGDFRHPASVVVLATTDVKIRTRLHSCAFFCMSLFVVALVLYHRSHQRHLWSHIKGKV